MVNNTSDLEFDTHKEILKIENTAELLRISTATVRNWIKSGQLPTYNKEEK